MPPVSHDERLRSVVPQALPERQAPTGPPSADKQRATQLASRIRERIHRRLGSRIHDLRVVVADKHVQLEGRCATYYSKQLAQHAALGVIEDEHLENAIEVMVGI